MRLKLICWDNFIPSPEIINFFGSDNRFVCVMLISWYLLSPSLIPLSFVYSRGTGYLPHGLLWPHHRGQCMVAMSQELKRQTCYMRSQSHERWWPALLKLKFGNGWLTSLAAVAKKNQFWFSIPIPIPIPGISIPIPFSIPPISIPIPIPELELELSCNSNSGIELTPTLVIDRKIHIDLYRLYR